MYKREERILTFGKSRVWGPALEVMILRQVVSDLGAVPASGAGARTKDLLRAGAGSSSLLLSPFSSVL